MEKESFQYEFSTESTQKLEEQQKKKSLSGCLVSLFITGALVVGTAGCMAAIFGDDDDDTCTDEDFDGYCDDDGSAYDDNDYYEVDGKKYYYKKGGVSTGGYKKGVGGSSGGSTS